MSIVADVLAACGIVAIVAGVWLVSPPSALIVAGMLLIATGIGLHYRPRRRPAGRRHDPRPTPAVTD